MPDLVNCELLAAVTVLSEEGSYLRAAQRIGITPSLLKRRITALEDQLEFRLFEPHSKKLEMTQQGKALI
jgi:DNA-binding transcriptional LysR family regulator